jgi:thioesterase domain-containing protein/acyl carrier protein
MRELLRTGWLPNAVQTITLAGEALDAQLVDDIHRNTGVRRVWNAYGPTECTVYATAILFPPGLKSSVIGRPIANVQVYVLDAHLEQVPIGIPGELYIGGEGLARGYFDRPALTASRFIPNPFGQGTRLYQTGDLVRWQADGNLEFLGRIDHQVKVRGFRIELGEIESELLKHPSVESAVVVAREYQNNEKRLMAYLTTRGEHARPSAMELRSGLRQVLPEYMIPSHFIVLDQFPLTATGKLDRKSLPEITDLAPAAPASAPSTLSTMECTLAEIWSEVLGINNIGVHDDFFELGGHSLIALRLVTRIGDRLGTQLRPSVLFEARNIASLAELLASRRLDDRTLCALKKGSKGKVYVLHTTDGDVLSYSEMVTALRNTPSVYGIRGKRIVETGDAHFSISQLADRYTEIICGEAADEQIALVGWSFGGLLAFEIAQQMGKLGRPASFVGLIDTYHPLQLYMRRLDLDSSLEQMAEKFDRKDRDMFAVRQTAESHKRHWKAMCEYMPDQFQGQLHFYRAKELDEFGLRADVRKWNQLAIGGVQLFEAPGCHFSMMKEPYVAELAAQLEDDIFGQFGRLVN